MPSVTCLALALPASHCTTPSAQVPLYPFLTLSFLQRQLSRCGKTRLFLSILLLLQQRERARERERERETAREREREREREGERTRGKTFKQPFSLEIDKNALRIIALAWHMPQTGTQTGTHRPPLILTAQIQTTLHCGSLQLVLVQSPFNRHSS